MIRGILSGFRSSSHSRLKVLVKTSRPSGSQGVQPTRNKTLTVSAASPSYRKTYPASGYDIVCSNSVPSGGSTGGSSGGRKGKGKSLILILIIRPTGFFGKKGITKV